MSTSGRSSPLIPLSEFDRNSLNQSRMSIESSQAFSEAGASVFSASTVLSRQNVGANRPRIDLGSVPSTYKKIRIENARNAMDDDAKPTADADESSKVYIWGTNICVEEIQRAFTKFITTFCAEVIGDDVADGLTEDEHMDFVVNGPLYMEKLRRISLSEVPILNVDLAHVRQFSDALYKNFIAYPTSVIPNLDITINEIFTQNFQTELPSPIEIRPYNVGDVRNMRDLNPTDIDQLITTSGMITRISPLIPEMNRGFFECSVCKKTEESFVEFGRIDEPVNCANCGNSYTMQLVHNRSFFIDKQVIKLQEIPGDAPTGQTQQTITLYVHGGLVENVHPGDRVSVTGIYRSNPVRQNPFQRAEKAVYRTSIDVIHFRKMSQGRLHEAGEGCHLSLERIEEIKEFGQRPDIIDVLTRAIAPNIFGHDEIKRGILCLLFGGCRKSDEKGNRVKLRSEINILLCGDPGTAKSQILQYVYHLMPRSQYTSGKGSSAVGLSAAVTHDPDTKGVVLQTGALVLADNGVCCIDEFDKMSDATRSILHEVMEQQTLSIAKAGIICQLNARTSILAAANPIDSKWNTEKNIVQNVHLPHTLLSRFDLIFLVLDPYDENYNRSLGKHLVDFYLEGNRELEEARALDLAFLRDYIGYAKEFVRPTIGTEARNTLVQKYLDMRSRGMGRGMVTAYPRQLESLIRLSEAFAKMRLSSVVEERDVTDAYNLYNEALRQSATDPKTGLIDVGIISTGASDTLKKKAEKAAEIIRKEIEFRTGGILMIKLFKDILVSNKAIDKESFDAGLAELQQSGQVVRTGDRIRFIAGAAK